MNHSPSLDARLLLSQEDDRRAFRRFPLHMLAFVRLPERQVQAFSDSRDLSDASLYTLQAVPVKDVSMTGLFFFSRVGYPIETEMIVRLCLEGKEYETAAVIERRVRVDNRLCGYGIRFLQSRMDKDLRVALAAFLLRRADGA